MYTDERELWRRVETMLEAGVPEAVRDYCRCMGLTEIFAPSEADEREALDEAVATIVDHCKCLQDAGLFAPLPRAESRVLTDTSDARWQLLAELGARYEEKYRDVDVHARQTLAAAVHVSQDHWSESAWPYGFDTSPRVRVDFDPRISQTMLFELLSQAWPWLRREGWVRPTRRLSERTIALLRFVCLEAPEDADWRTRQRLWNERYPQWRVRDPRAFHARFRRAEEQLTGRKGGLVDLYTSREEQRRRGRARADRRLAELRDTDPNERRRLAAEHRERRIARALKRQGKRGGEP